jgi:ADP-ribose pyrophosphatase YjhB (NUDIX family)
MTVWKAPSVPQHVVQFIPIDKHGRFLTLQRGADVRSAANCRSFPSGMHDIGYFAQQVIEHEAAEELGVEVLEVKLFDIYENIGGDYGAEEQYHWVISLWFALIEDCNKAENLEPKKHDFIDSHPIARLSDLSWYNGFHPSFMGFVTARYADLGLEARVFARKAEINEALRVQ